MFIEKYKIAMEDKTGYAQLVIYPPPLNIFCIFLSPIVLSKNNMKKVAVGYQKFIYWVENFFFSLCFLIYEFVFLPLIYLKVFYNILKLANWDNLMQVFFIWLVGGPFCMLFNILTDFFNFMKILCSYDEDEEAKKDKDKEEFKQDKIVLFNEMLDVLRGIKHIKIGHHMEEERRRRKKKKDAKPITFAEIEESIDFYIDRESLKKAWMMYRPSSKVGTPAEGDDNQMFTNVIRKLKNKPDKDSEPPDQYRKAILKMIRRKNSEEYFEEEEEEDEFESKIPFEEVQLIEFFLNKLVFTSENANSTSIIDIKLALRSLPEKVTEENVYRVELLGFKTIQDSLVGYQNDEQDELFMYYDRRQKSRFNDFERKINDCKYQSELLRSVAEGLMEQMQ